MDKHKHADLIGHPSDYGSRTLADEAERPQAGDSENVRTADGEPLVDHGSVDDERHSKE